jgi:hypothetical protein
MTMLLNHAWVGNLDMADIAQAVLFVLACAFLFGLGLYLFRDQVWPERYKSSG